MDTSCGGILAGRDQEELSLLYAAFRLRAALAGGSIGGTIDSVSALLLRNWEREFAFRRALGEAADEECAAEGGGTMLTLVKGLEPAARCEFAQYVLSDAFLGHGRHWPALRFWVEYLVGRGSA